MHHPPESADCVLLGLGRNISTVCAVHSAAAGWILHSTLYVTRGFSFCSCGIYTFSHRGIVYSIYRGIDKFDAQKVH